MQNNKEEKPAVDTAAVSAEWLTLRLLDLAKEIQSFTQEPQRDKIMPPEKVEELKAAIIAALTNLRKNYYSQEPQKLSQLSFNVGEWIWKLQHCL